MSLKGRIGMLGIDHQHGRYGSNEPGADPRRLYANNGGKPGQEEVSTNPNDV
jgi:hypothetical protein